MIVLSGLEGYDDVVGAVLVVVAFQIFSIRCSLNFQGVLVAVGNVMKVVMISGMTCRSHWKMHLKAYTKIFQSRYHQNAIVVQARGLLMEVSQALAEHVGVLAECGLSKDFLRLSGLATPVKAWGR